MDDWHPGNSRQNVGKEFWRLGRNMQHNADRRGKTGRQIPGELTQRLDATGRGPDHDDTANRHGSARRRKVMRISHQRPSEPLMSSTAESASRSSQNDGLVVVGLGASAGGISALRQAFFSHVSPNGSVAYVVILHLSPDHDSQLAEVLQVMLPFPVTQVTENEPLEARSRLRHLAEQEPDDGGWPSAGGRDHARRAAPLAGRRVLPHARLLARLERRRVILSGTGANGSAGIKPIKEHGGLSIAQDPAEAEYTDMPGNAIATGCVDLVLRVEEMPARIVAYRDHLEAGRAEPRDDAGRPGALREILTLLKVRTGNDFSNYKPATLLRRIHRRMTVADVATLVALRASGSASIPTRR